MARTPAEKRRLKNFGDNLRRERVARHCSQEVLAERSGLNPRTIQKIERGDINILLTTISRIQAALGCSWPALLGPEAKLRRTQIFNMGR